jgi:signal peptidase I
MATDKDKNDGGWGKLFRDIAFILILVLGIHSIVAKPFYIPSESMMPILRNGDRLVVSKYPYGWSYASISFHLAPPFAGRLWKELPERGDIVVLEHPVTRQDYIKRVIGLPGDTVAVKDGALIINGRRIKREAQPMLTIPADANLPDRNSLFAASIHRNAGGQPVIDVPIIRETLPGGAVFDTIDLGPGYPNDNYGPVTVPVDHVFLMGDNRDGSADSRVPTALNGLGGPVPFESISGRAEMISFSTDGTAIWYNPISWFRALRSGRAGTSLRPDHDSVPAT